MTIGKKIVGGFAVVLALLLVITATAFYSVNEMRRTYAGVLELHTNLIENALELGYTAESEVASFRGIFVHPGRTKIYTDELEQRFRDFDTTVEAMRPRVDGEGKRLLEEIVELHGARKLGTEKIIELLNRGKRDQAEDVENRDVAPVTPQFRRKVAGFIEWARKMEEASNARLSASISRILFALGAISSVALLFGGAFAFSLSRSLTRQFRENISRLSSSTTEIMATAAQVAAGAAETATAVTETNATVEELRQTTHLATQKAKAVSEASQKTLQVSQEGKRSVEESTGRMRDIQGQMSSVADCILKLSDQNQVIGEIMATVNDLAEQSNLLAVNAAIEAAKAGDHGKGFTVVAQEVRNLAQQSKQATTQVRSILNDIQKATSAAVMATEQGTRSVETGMKQALEAGEAIRMLAGSFAETSQMAIQIAASSQQQMAGTEQIGLAMESIRQATDQNLAGIKQVEQAAQALNEMGLRIQAMIERAKR